MIGMKDISRLFILLMLFTFTSCEVIGDIFSAGFYTALILVVLVIGIIAYIVIKVKHK